MDIAKPVFFVVGTDGQGHQVWRKRSGRGRGGHAAHKADPLSRWIRAVPARRGTNSAPGALANKLVRLAWVRLTRAESDPPARAAAGAEDKPESRFLPRECVGSEQDDDPTGYRRPARRGYPTVSPAR